MGRHFVWTLFCTHLPFLRETSTVYFPTTFLAVHATLAYPFSARLQWSIFPRPFSLYSLLSLIHSCFSLLAENRMAMTIGLTSNLLLNPLDRRHAFQFMLSHSRSITPNLLYKNCGQIRTCLSPRFRVHCESKVILWLLGNVLDGFLVINLTV